jgi:hypothetical protein
VCDPVLVEVVDEYIRCMPTVPQGSCRHHQRLGGLCREDAISVDLYDTSSPTCTPDVARGASQFSTYREVTPLDTLKLLENSETCEKPMVADCGKPKVKWSYPTCCHGNE